MQFDTEYEFLYKGVPISQVPKYNLMPRGGNDLLDAVGRAINETAERLSKMAEQERPGKVVFVVMTDGLENSSKEFSKAKIKDMIEPQQDTYTWHFSFFGHNQDAFAEADGIGIQAAGVATYKTDKVAGSYRSDRVQDSADALAAAWRKDRK